MNMNLVFLKTSNNDRSNHKAVMNALGVIGFSEGEIESIYQILASILLLVREAIGIDISVPSCVRSYNSPVLPCQGNIQFESDGESVQIQGLETINHISELMGTDPESVSKSLLYRTVATGGGEVIEKGHSEQEACCGRDAFVKVLLNYFMCLSFIEISHFTR